MQLMDYRRSDEHDLVDAVFLDGDGRYWHFQKVDTRHPTHEQARPRIQLKDLQHTPVIGVVAGDYQQKVLSGKSHLVIDSLWCELMLTALWAVSGWAAMGITFL